jgi:predicted nuclease with TOPRIM domain
MNDREKMLGEFHAGVGGIDPQLDKAAEYAGAIKAVGKVVKSQGQVMSQTLSNNAMLWEERKALRAENALLKSQMAVLVGERRDLERKVAELTEAVEKFEASGGDRWRALYESARKTLVGYLHDQLDEEQLKERLGDMKRQNEQLLAEGVKPVPLPSAEAVAEHIEREGVEL